MASQFINTQNITKELFGDSPSLVIELFAISDILNSDEIIRFHGGVNELRESIIFDSKEYFYIPLEADGFAIAGDGAMVRPMLRMINIDGFLSNYIIDKNDLVGASLSRIRTFFKFLDKENFHNYDQDVEFWNSKGVNPDSGSKLRPETWVINRKTRENKYLVEFEVVSPLELENVSVPRRQIINNFCPWKFRGKGCGYVGPPVADANDGLFDKSSITESPSNGGEWVNDESYTASQYVFIGTPEGNDTRKTFFVCLKDHTSNSKNKPTVGSGYWAADQCSKTLDACKRRFLGNAKEQLPFGGFPGSRIF
jgi:lambda family phage minor tail protein L